MTRPSADMIRNRIAEAFPGDTIQVDDESHLHAGHAGATAGAGHYRVRITSHRFNGLAPLARHRLVYDAVADWMPERIHALSIDARVPPDAPGT